MLTSAIQLQTQAGTPRENARAVWLFVPVLAVVAGLLLAPGLAIGPSLDAAVFTTIGEQLGHGAVLYRDAWDHKPPGIYVLLVAGQAILPWMAPWVVSWLLSLGATILAGSAIAWTLRLVGVSWWAAASAALLATAGMAQYLTALGGGLTEPVGAAGAAAGIAAWVATRRWTIRHLLPGLLLGLATLSSLQLAPAVLSVGVLVALSGGRARVPRLLLFAAGVLIPWLLSAVVLAATGSLSAAVDAMLRYPAAYRVAAGAFGADLSTAPAAWTLLSFLALVAPGALGALALSRGTGERRSLLVGLAAWLVAAILLIPFQGRFIAHYAIPLVVPLGLLAGVGMDIAVVRLRRGGGRGRGLLAGIVLGTAVVSMAASYFGGRYELDTNRARSAQVAATARYVDEHSDPGDAILVWGNRPEVYVAAGRSPALLFSFMYPLTTEGYVTHELVEEVAADLALHLPALIVDAGSAAPGEPGFLPLLIDRPVASEGRELDILDPLRSIIRDHYELAATPAGWPIYRLRSAGSTGDE